MARSNVSPEDWAAINAALKALGAPGDDWKPPVEVQVAWRAAWALELREDVRRRIEDAQVAEDVAALDVVIARLTVGPSAKRVVCLDTESDDAMRAAVAECIRRCAEPLARGVWDEKRAAGQLVVLLKALGVKATAGQAGAMLRAWLDEPASEADKLTPCVCREVVLASGSAEPAPSPVIPSVATVNDLPKDPERDQLVVVVSPPGLWMFQCTTLRQFDPVVERVDKGRWVEVDTAKVGSVEPKAGGTKP